MTDPLLKELQEFIVDEVDENDGICTTEAIGMLFGVCWYLAQTVGVPEADMLRSFEAVGKTAKRSMN